MQQLDAHNDRTQSKPEEELPPGIKAIRTLQSQGIRTTTVLRLNWFGCLELLRSFEIRSHDSFGWLRKGPPFGFTVRVIYLEPSEIVLFWGANSLNVPTWNSKVWTSK